MSRQGEVAPRPPQTEAASAHLPRDATQATTFNVHHADVKAIVTRMWLLSRSLLGPDDRQRLEREVLPLGSLQEVVRWSFAQTPPVPVAGVVVQDEFSHDVVMQWHQGQFLVFDTT